LLKFVKLGKVKLATTTTAKEIQANPEEATDNWKRLIIFLGKILLIKLSIKRLFQKSKNQQIASSNLKKISVNFYPSRFLILRKYIQK